MKSMVVAEGERQVKLTNLDKILYPESGYTKAHLLRYLSNVAPHMLPHLKARPLVMTRYPDGIHGKSFYQKNAPKTRPLGSQTFPFRHGSRQGPVEYFLAGDRVDLLWLGNLGCLEIHAWQSRRGSIRHPDWAVFDLDPAPPAAYPEAVTGALRLRELLGTVGLEGYAKTSGGKGVHVYVPLDPAHSYEDVTAWVRGVGRLLDRRFPGFFTLERAVKKRRGVYVDYLQNGLGRTMAAPYSPRPRPGAPVSTPVTWDELERVSPGDLTLTTVLDLLDRRGDPFLPVLEGGQQITSQ